MGFVAPAVSIIGGLAGIASKNQQAAAQREQINAQAYQSKVSEMANSAMLERQQVLARQEYEIGVVNRLQAYSQAQAGLQAQSQLADLKAQQDNYNVQYQALQQRGALEQTQQQLERQRLDMTVQADQKLGASATKEGGLNTQLTNQTLKEMATQTAEDRKRISAQAAGRMSSSSSLTRGERVLADDIATALSQGLDTDRTAIQAHIQQLSEEEQAILAERIGLNDNASNMDTVTANIRLAALGAQGALTQNEADRANTQSSIGIASKLMTNDANSQAKAAQDAYRYQDYALGINRDTAQKTGQSVQSAYQSASANTRGAGFADYLNLGVSTYGAVSPLLGGGASAADKAKQGLGESTTPQVKYSGFVPGNNA
jgi:hypothetical protein